MKPNQPRDMGHTVTGKATPLSLLRSGQASIGMVPGHSLTLSSGHRHLGYTVPDSTLSQPPMLERLSYASVLLERSMEHAP